MDNGQLTMEKQELLKAANLLLEFLDTDKKSLNFQMRTEDGVILSMDVGYVWEGLKAIKQYAAGDFKAGTRVDGFRAVPPCTEGAET